MTQGANPWLTRPEEPEQAAVPEPVQPLVPWGPSRPQARVPVPDHVDQLPIYQMPRAAQLWIVGAHGGSGESTLAALSPDWTETCHGWPAADPSNPVRVLVVARSNSAGLRAAQRAAQQWASGSVPGVSLVGLVTIADAPGRLPRPLR